MDRKTMDKELDKLVEDSAFRRYHEEQPKRREFNAFDVLRYADYEIRHSNVLAWLLDPGETHGVGRAFLDWFLGIVDASISDHGAPRVRVERELHRVDVAVFLESDSDRRIVAIENKVGGYSPEHSDQVLHYDKMLTAEYPESHVHNVLLTASREVPALDPAITHVSWSAVGARIKEMHNADAFEREEVAAFVRQYLVAVGRLIGTHEHDDHYFRKLLNGHRSLLSHLFRVLVSDGDDKVGATVSDRHAHYRDTVVRLVRAFGQEPERLRGVVRGMLENEGIDTTTRNDKWKTAFWLNWDLEQADALGIGRWLRWTIEFTYGEVSATLEARPGRPPEVKRILDFMRETPVDRRRRNRYPMRGAAFGFFNIYSHQLVGDEVLSGRSTRAVTEDVLREVKNFLDSEDSDYKRIRDYFKCLAFRRDGAAEGEDEAPT